MMAQERFSLPFTIDASTDDLMEGVFEITGLLRVEDDGFILEFRRSGFDISGLGHVGKNRPGDLHLSGRPAVESVAFTLDDLRDIQLKWGVFSAKIVLHARSLTVFADVPGAAGDRLVLDLPKASRGPAATLVPLLRIALEERQ